MATLGEIVRRERLRAGISQRTLARRAGTSQAAISRIERGLEEPSFERFAHAMSGLGYEPAVELRPIAVSDAASRQLIEQATKSPQTRFEELINWSRFARQIGRSSGDGG